MSELIEPRKTRLIKTMGQGVFSSAKCQQVDLRYRVGRDIFDWQRLLAFFGKDQEEGRDGKYTSVVCRTLDAENLDYHIHFHWTSSKDAFVLYVSFHAGAFAESDGEREPYAERFMSWLGGFMNNDTAHADLHAEFEYPNGVRRSRFPLPMRITVSKDDLEAEVRGIEALFPASPEGISGAQIRKGRRACP